MADETTVYISETYGPLRVCEMHPHHARNALARVLSDAEHASRQFSTPTFSSERNQNLHAKASGLRYVVMTYHQVPAPAGVVQGSVTNVPVPRYIGRRAQARLVRKASKEAGLRPTIYKITNEGLLERVH